MPDQDKDALETGEPNEFMPAEEDFEDELEAEEEEEAFDEAPLPSRADRAAAREAERTGRRFRFGRGDEQAEHVPGSLRASHERVRVDDRASAIFALVCAVGLVGILVAGFAGQYVPKAAAPTLKTLGLETFAPAPTPTGGASASASPTLTPSPTPTPTPSPTASPSAS